MAMRWVDPRHWMVFFIGPDQELVLTDEGWSSRATTSMPGTGCRGQSVSRGGASVH
jgi:hypothetical protein